MPGSYADLLREAQARKQAEQKLAAAEAVLKHIKAIHFFAPYSEDGPKTDGYCVQCDVKYPCLTTRILDGES